MIEAGERFADIDVCCQINNLAPNEMLMKIAKPASLRLRLFEYTQSMTRKAPTIAADCISPRFGRFLNL